METVVKNATNTPRCHESSKFRPDMGEFLLFLENNFSCIPEIGYYTHTNGFVSVNGESINPPKYWAYAGVSLGVDKKH